MPVQIEFVTFDFERPPIMQYFFDVRLQNTKSQARWFLLPDEGKSPQSMPYAIDTCDVYHLGNQAAEVIVGYFSGTHGFYALQLPAGGQVVLESFPLMVIDECPDQFIIEIITATRLTIGEEPVENWFGTKTLSRSEAKVLAETMTNQLDVVFSRGTSDHEEVDVEFIEDERLQLIIAT